MSVLLGEDEDIEFCTRKIHRGLPQQTISVCPECKTKIWATIDIQDGRVVMTKTCPDHGFFSDVLNTDPYLFLKAERWCFADGPGISNPQVTGSRPRCPEDCGLCSMHLSLPAQVNIDLTNRCNLKCPFCFANAARQGFVYEPNWSQVRRMLEAAASIRPWQMNAIQFAGGEPTLVDIFPSACRYAKNLGFKVVHVATNGLRFSELDFCQAAKGAGLDGLYLQFDGLDDKIYLRTRGRALLTLKEQVVRNCRQVGLWVVLVPTIIQGVNDQEVGKILQFAINNADVMQGIAFQPVAFTGRIDYEERVSQRYTIGDLAHDLDDQTNGLICAHRDFYPLSVLQPLTEFFSLVLPKAEGAYLNLTNHPNCGQGTYILVDRYMGKAVPITALFDFESLLLAFQELNGNMMSAFTKPRYSFKGLSTGLKILRKYFYCQNPLNIDFWEFLRAFMGIMGRSRAGYYRGRWKFLMVGGMHFQDLYNYQISRIMRCVIHYAAPDPESDGERIKFYPFCVYNAFGMREKIESRFQRKMH